METSVKSKHSVLSLFYVALIYKYTFLVENEFTLELETTSFF